MAAMIASQFCQRCGKELDSADIAEGFCLACGEAVPLVAEGTGESEALPESADDSPSEEERRITWEMEDGFAVCPLCMTSYSAGEVPAQCEICAQDPVHANDIWVLPENEREEAALVLVHAKSGERVPVKDGTLLGRSTVACLAQDRYVSRRHASIAEKDGKLFLTDENSDNGTRVNGKQLVPGEAEEIVPGDEIMLDEQVFRAVEGS